jgi:hypothetical protein
VSAADDYSGEMPGSRQIDDATAEQLLGGRRVPAELESVATVVRALREVSTQPVRPSDTLRRQMAAGSFTGSPAYAYRPGSRDNPVRRVATVLVVRIGRLRLGTKLVAAGAAVAVLSVGSAGFAGTLPAPVQSRFETVVESVTPYQFPEKSASSGDRGSPQRQPGGGPDEESTGDTTDRDRPGRGPDAGPSGEPGNGNGNANGHGNGNGNGNNGNGNDNGNNGNGNGNRDRDRD